ncbi:MAG: hypothetical protein ABSG53_03020 [Thermoguttaceae bacterium]|jgi:hypothetical protein
MAAPKGAISIGPLLASNSAKKVWHNDLCKQYEIETLREYRHRSREQINERRKKGERV